jgi:hypothetical protein
VRLMLIVFLSNNRTLKFVSLEDSMPIISLSLCPPWYFQQVLRLKMGLFGSISAPKDYIIPWQTLARTWVLGFER